MTAARRNGERFTPRLYARVAGLTYLITIVLGTAEQVWMRGSIYVPRDVAATAANLKSMEFLWRLGIASEMFLLICTIVTVLTLYALLRPVSRHLALLMAFFGLVGVAVEAGHALHLLEALLPLGKADYLKAFTPEQLAAMASLAIRAHSLGFGMALLFFGPFCLTAGYLLFQSGYFPKAIGLLYLIPGVSYGGSSFVLILAPAFSARYYFVIAGPAVIGEAALTLWLLVKGVKAASWEELSSPGLSAEAQPQRAS